VHGFRHDFLADAVADAVNAIGVRENSSAALARRGYTIRHLQSRARGLIAMIRPVTVPRPVPELLSFIAGYVDATMFLGLFGIFVAQMTGSFVLVGTQFVAPEHGLAVKLWGIPVFFLAGCVATGLAVATGEHGERAALAWVMGLECTLLTALTAVLLAVKVTSMDATAAQAAALLGLAAMGVQSAMVRLLMSGVASTNVMTTNTTQLAIDSTLVLIEVWQRKSRSAVSPGIRAARERLSGTLPIAVGFVLGTAAGALSYAIAEFMTLLIPVVISYALLAWMVAGTFARTSS
jgi:uncharacterized membrane protein YoaK (UPF0700 family)